MSIADLVRRLATAGASPDAIAIAVEALELKDQQVAQRKQAANERKQRQRDKSRGVSRDSHAQITEQSNDVTGQSQDALPPSSAPLVPPSSSPTPPITTPLNPPTINPQPSTPAPFERFWEAFPKQRRGNQRKALNAYRNALKRTTEEKIYETTVRYAGSDEVKRGFAKGAAAWLNDDRWTVDYSVKPQAVTAQGRPAYGDIVENATRFVLDKIQRDREIREEVD